jgi:hypothetical protein
VLSLKSAIAIPSLFTKRNFSKKVALEINIGKAYSLFLAETKAGDRSTPKVRSR